MMNQEDRVVDLLLALNCPYINKSDSKENIIKWVDRIHENKEEKNLLLNWILQTLGEATSNPGQSLLNLGILGKSQECNQFLGGGLKKDYEKCIWDSMFDLLYIHTQCNLTKEDSMTTKTRLEGFLDTLTSEVNLSGQLEKPVSVLDYALEKEVSKHKSSGNISRSVITNIHCKVEEEKENLNIKLQTSTSQIEDSHNQLDSVDDLASELDSLRCECDRTAASATQFDARFTTQLRPVLATPSAGTAVAFGADSAGDEGRDDIRRFFDLTQDLNSFLHGSHSAYTQMEEIARLKSETVPANFTSLT